MKTKNLLKGFLVVAVMLCICACNDSEKSESQNIIVDVEEVFTNTDKYLNQTIQLKGFLPFEIIDEPTLLTLDWKKEVVLKDLGDTCLAGGFEAIAKGKLIKDGDKLLLRCEDINVNEMIMRGEGATVIYRIEEVVNNVDKYLNQTIQVKGFLPFEVIDEPVLTTTDWKTEIIIKKKEDGVNMGGGFEATVKGKLTKDGDKLVIECEEYSINDSVQRDQE